MQLGGLEVADDVSRGRERLRDPAEVVLHLVVQVGHAVLVGEGQQLGGVGAQIGVRELLCVEVPEEDPEDPDIDVREPDLLGSRLGQALAEQRHADPGLDDARVDLNAHGVRADNEGDDALVGVGVLEHPRHAPLERQPLGRRGGVDAAALVMIQVQIHRRVQHHPLAVLGPRLVVYESDGEAAVEFERDVGGAQLGGDVVD